VSLGYSSQCSHFLKKRNPHFVFFPNDGVDRKCWAWERGRSSGVTKQLGTWSKMGRFNYMQQFGRPSNQLSSSNVQPRSMLRPRHATAQAVECTKYATFVILPTCKHTTNVLLGNKNMNFYHKFLLSRSFFIFLLLHPTSPRAA
jgi:hypothetical protein